MSWKLSRGTAFSPHITREGAPHAARIKPFEEDLMLTIGDRFPVSYDRPRSAAVGPRRAAGKLFRVGLIGF
jgi:hypothetical protein